MMNFNKRKSEVSFVILYHFHVVGPFALILAPTRELATQIFDECRKFAYRTWIKPAVVYGGADPREMYYSMKEGSDILVATPGRLLSYLVKNQVSLESCCYLVLDEADR
jgi:ATP-dependent RNA helicase DDX3X